MAGSAVRYSSGGRHPPGNGRGGGSNRHHRAQPGENGPSIDVDDTDRSSDEDEDSADEYAADGFVVDDHDALIPEDEADVLGNAEKQLRKKRRLSRAAAADKENRASGTRPVASGKSGGNEAAASRRRQPLMDANASNRETAPSGAYRPHGSSSARPAASSSSARPAASSARPVAPAARAGSAAPNHAGASALAPGASAATVIDLISDEDEPIQETRASAEAPLRGTGALEEGREAAPPAAEDEDGGRSRSSSLGSPVAGSGPSRLSRLRKNAPNSVPDEEEEGEGPPPAEPAAPASGPSASAAPPEASRRPRLRKNAPDSVDDAEEADVGGPPSAGPDTPPSGPPAFPEQAAASWEGCGDSDGEGDGSVRSADISGQPTPFSDSDEGEAPAPESAPASAPAPAPAPAPAAETSSQAWVPEAVPGERPGPADDGGSDTDSILEPIPGFSKPYNHAPPPAPSRSPAPGPSSARSPPCWGRADLSPVPSPFPDPICASPRASQASLEEGRGGAPSPRGPGGARRRPQQTRRGDRGEASPDGSEADGEEDEGARAREPPGGRRAAKRRTSSSALRGRKRKEEDEGEEGLAPAPPAGRRGAPRGRKRKPARGASSPSSSSSSSSEEGEPAPRWAARGRRRPRSASSSPSEGEEGAQKKRRRQARGKRPEAAGKGRGGRGGKARGGRRTDESDFVVSDGASIEYESDAGSEKMLDQEEVVAEVERQLQEEEALREERTMARVSRNVEGYKRGASGTVMDGGILEELGATFRRDPQRDFDDAFRRWARALFGQLRHQSPRAARRDPELLRAQQTVRRRLYEAAEVVQSNIWAREFKYAIETLPIVDESNDFSERCGSCNREVGSARKTWLVFDAFSYHPEAFWTSPSAHPVLTPRGGASSSSRAETPEEQRPAFAVGPACWYIARSFHFLFHYKYHFCRELQKYAEANKRLTELPEDWIEEKRDLVLQHADEAKEYRRDARADRAEGFVDVFGRSVRRGVSSSEVDDDDAARRSYDPFAPDPQRQRAGRILPRWLREDLR
eukprot:tig00020830_g14505.t1